MHMRASRASCGMQMWLWLESPMHLEDGASESIPKHCFYSARALAGAESTIVIERHARGMLMSAETIMFVVLENPWS